METCSGREPSANTATELGEPEDREMRKRPILGDGELIFRHSSLCCDSRSKEGKMSLSPDLQRVFPLHQFS